MDSTALLFGAAGLAALAAAILPKVLGKFPLSMPMIFFAAGILAFSLLDFLPSPDPVAHGVLTLHLTEMCVIISLMGAGLAINRPFRIKSWRTTWRLLGITMPLSIIAVGFLGWWILGLGVAAAVLLAAALAPTDPVLATEVQVGEPTENDEGTDEDEARFVLTSEAGLNDGLAFPFTYIAIAISTAGLAPQGWLGEWILIDLLWRLSIGVLVGVGIGWMLGRLFFSAPAQRLRFSENVEGFTALAATFLAYGAAELINGYGFIAVFVCACTIRASERSHGYHRVLHNFVEQIERLLTVVILVLLGGAVARGLLAEIGWTEIGVVALILLVVRPLAGWIGLIKGRTGLQERAVISFFGVRGIGSLFYIAYALEKGDFADGTYLWAVVGLTVVGSIVIHGAAASPVMGYLDAQRSKEAARRNRPNEAPTTPV